METCSSIYHCLQPVRENFHDRALNYLIALNKDRNAPFDMKCFDWLLGIARNHVLDFENLLLWLRFFSTSLEKLNKDHCLTQTQTLQAISKLLDACPFSLYTILKLCSKYEPANFDIILSHPQTIPIISKLIESQQFMVSSKACSYCFFYHSCLELHQKKAYLENYLKWCYDGNDESLLLRSVIEDSTFDKTEFATALIQCLFKQKTCGEAEALLTLYLKQYSKEQRLSLIREAGIDLFSALTSNEEIFLWYFHRFPEDVHQSFDDILTTMLRRGDFLFVLTVLEKREQLGMQSFNT